jgi:predicted TIM-barrel fold metal-dependent hydrolase
MPYAFIRRLTMIIDFHIHYTPEEMVRDKLGPGGSPRTVFVNGTPAYSYHNKLYALEKHIDAMDKAGIDVAVLSSGAGLVSDLNQCRRVNDRLKWVEGQFPGRFLGLAHVPPLGGEPSFRELERTVFELGFRGVSIPSVLGETELDAPELRPFFKKVSEMGLFVFIHPALSSSGNYLDYDLGRSVGREFQLVLTVIRLINGGVLDDFPELKFVVSHLGGGIAALLGRIEPYQDKEFWGTAQHPRHGKLPRGPFREYLDKIYFDTGGFFGNINAVKCALVEIKPKNIVFGTDYPQEIRDESQLVEFVRGFDTLSLSRDEINGIFSENGKQLLKIK